MSVVDSTLEVLSELPKRYKEWDRAPGDQMWFPTARLTRRWRKADPTSLYYCAECGGWIAGPSNRQEVREPGKTGRRGFRFNCRRCGYSLGFLSSQPKGDDR